MKRKLLSMALCLCMMLTLLPTAAWAADSKTVTVGGVKLTSTDSASVYATTDSGAVTTGAATADHYNVKWDGTTLTLRDATIKGATSDDNNYGIYAPAELAGLNIVLVGTNTVTGGTVSGDEGDSYGIYGSSASITISGDGTLNATGGTASIDKGRSYGICSSGGSVTIEGNATVIAIGGTANYESRGIEGSSVTISGGQVTATGGSSNRNSAGIWSNRSVTISGSAKVTATGGSAGIYSLGSITISGSAKVVATGGTAKNDSYGIYGYSSITYNGGLLVAKGGKALNKGAAVGSLTADTYVATGSAISSYYVISPVTTGNPAYHVYAESIDHTDTDKQGVAWSANKDLTLTNTIIIGTDANALTIPDGGKLTLEGFNVVLAGDTPGDNMAVKGEGALTIDGSGSLVAIGGSNGIYSGSTITLSGGSGAAIAGSDEAKAMNTAPSIPEAKAKAMEITGTNSDKAMTWKYSPRIEIDLDGNDAPVEYSSFQEGWNAAITGNTANTTVKLLTDWTAAGGSFGTGAGFGATGTEATNSGSLLVPADTHITLDLNGKTIDRGLTEAAPNGSVIRVLGDLTLSDSGTGTTPGKITGGADSSITNSTGGAVYVVETGSFTMTGGSITGNGGGGVYVGETGSFSVSGAPVITDNTSNGGERNVYLGAGKTITVTGALTRGASIGVTTEIAPPDTAPITVAMGGASPSYTITADDAAKFTSDAAQYILYQDATDHNIKLCQPYLVMLDEAENGYFTLSPERTENYYAAGEKVTVVPQPDNGYVVDKVTCVNDSGTVPVTNNSFTMPAGDVMVTVTFKVRPSNGGGGGTPAPATDFTPAPVTVYNDPSQPNATIWLTGMGLSNSDQLVTVRNPQGSAYEALLKLADSGDVFATYNIYLRSGKKPAGSAMNLSFDLNAKYAGQDFTLVHQKADTTHEYFYDSADANGDLSFGPLYELSPFMLVAGTLTPFEDVAESDWFNKDVAYVYQNGMMSGVGDGAFDPLGTTTRAMIVTILYRLEGEPAFVHKDTFSDVDEGAYYHDAVLWVAQNGLVNGYGNDKFGPEDPITREQLAAILYRYAQYKGYDVSVGEDTNILSYNDALDISEYAIPAMQWACGAGLIQGSDGNLLPQGSAQRCQVAAILHRFCEAVVK